jgi:hypothetical protein
MSDGRKISFTVERLPLPAHHGGFSDPGEVFDGNVGKITGYSRAYGIQSS